MISFKCTDNFLPVPVAVSPAIAPAVICETISCVIIPLVVSNTRLTENEAMFSDCEYADCVNLIVTV